MASNRQEFITLLFLNGIGMSANEVDRIIMKNNNFEMTIPERYKWCIDNFDKCKIWFI